MLCQRSVRWLLARDRHARLRFAPLQGETARALGVTRDLRPSNLDTVLLVEQDAAGRLRVHDRTAAVAQALVAVGGPWSLLGRALLLVPRPLADAVYRFAAARRHRLGAARCDLPADRTRFLP